MNCNEFLQKIEEADIVCIKNDIERSSRTPTPIKDGEHYISVVTKTYGYEGGNYWDDETPTPLPLPMVKVRTP